MLFSIGSALAQGTPDAPATSSPPTPRPSAQQVSALVADMEASRPLWDLYKRRAYADAAVLAQPAAEQGSASAQYILAMLLFGGQGVATDAEAARIWLERSTAQDLPDAWEQTESMLRRGGATGATSSSVRNALARGAAANAAIARYQLERVSPAQFAQYAGDGAARRYWVERERYFDNREALYRGERPSVQQKVVLSPQLPASCRPQRPRLAPMQALGVTQLDGSLDVYIGSGGRIDGVSVKDVSDERLRLWAFDLLNESLHAPDCVISGVEGIHIRIPFRYRLDS